MRRALSLLRELHKTVDACIDYGWTAITNQHCRRHCTHRATHRCEGK